MNRRSVLLAATLFMSLAGSTFLARTALAANAAEDFVATNIHAGFDLLNDPALSAAERKARFAAFLLGLTDERHIALYLLGAYAQSAPQADVDDYVAAYHDYILAVYQSYFEKYAGQSLRVIDSHERAPNDFVVRTNLINGAATAPEIDFRVRTNGPKPELVDLRVEGAWLAIAQHDEFAAVLGQSHGDIKALTAHLRAVEKLYR